MFYKINNINFYSTVEGEPLEIPEIHRELGIHKNKCQDIFIITDIKTGAKIAESKTKDKAIKELLKLKDDINSLDKEREEYLIKELNRLVDYDTLNKYQEIFSGTFGHDIVTFCNIWVLDISHKIKLDLPRFDDYFKHEPDYHNISLKKWIQSKYGDNVLQVVEYFL